MKQTWRKQAILGTDKPHDLFIECAHAEVQAWVIKWQ